MTTTNTNVKNTYNGDGAATNFPITPDIRDKDFVKVFLIDTTTLDPSTPSGYDETEQFETADFTFDVLPIPTTVIMNTPPAGTERLRVERQTPLTQTDIEPEGAVLEERLDRITHMHQEVAARVGEVENQVDVPATPTPISAVAPDWVAGTDYTKDMLVVNLQSLYRATADHTASLVDFDDDLALGRWELMVGFAGPQGPQGDVGPQGVAGNDGNDGAQGIQGPAGADGVFTEIASQGEAELGTDNAKGMTPLRTSQAIDAQVDKNGIVSNTNRNDAQDLLITDLVNRVAILESQVQQATGKFAGQQTLVNSQGVPTPLIGALNGGVNDKGFGFSRESSGAEFAEVLVLFKRITSTETRVASASVVMQFVDGTWYVGRKGTEQFDESLDLDGVTLTIDATGQVLYTTDAMGGANHEDESIIAWLGQEISK